MCNLNQGGRLSALILPSEITEKEELLLNKLFKLFRKYVNVISYLFFGALTTLINFLVYFPLYNWFCFSAVFSNVVAWIVAVCFAFLTNKPFVFKSYDWSMKTVIDEALKFVGCRIGSGVFETVAIWLLVDTLYWNGNMTKICVSIFVVVLNYISSKWLVFKKI